MFALLRRDPLISSHALKMGVVMALNAVLVAGLAVLLSASPGTRTFGPFGRLALLAVPIWLSIFPFLCFGKVAQRCLPFDLALPHSARTLWLAHVIALSLFGLALLALSGGILHLLFSFLYKAPQYPSMFPAAWIDLILPMAASFILVGVLLQRASPSQWCIPRTGKYISLSVLAVCGALGLILALAALSAWLAILPLVLALVLGHRTWRSVPPTFTLVPFEAQECEQPSAVQNDAAPHRERAPDWEEDAGGRDAGGIGFAWLLFRSLYGKLALKGYACFAFYPLLILLGIVLSGFISVWKDIELPQLTWLFLTAYLLFTLLPAQMVPLQFFSLLPISLRRIFACLMLPGILAFALGYGIGGAGKALIQGSRLMVKFQKERTSLLPTYSSKYPQVRVPAQYFEIAWDGRAPENTSPWGESHPARTDALYAGSRIAVYEPFSTPGDCTPQFAALQISRAMQAVYGKSIPYQQVLDRYLEVKGNAAVALKQGAGRLLQDYPDLIPLREIPLFPIVMLVIAGTWLLMAALYFRATRATVTDARRKGIYFGMLAVVLLINLAPVPTTITGFARLEVVGAFLSVLIRYAVDALPGGTPALWFICAIPLLGLYWLAQSQFQRIELVPGRPWR
ncbi:MAG: hypothetical protein LAP85_11565 [Acidobacteriia bacterium]|nr:hypothetical protein [Terriglobia bacterium]